MLRCSPSEFGQEGVRLTLTADLANAYFQLLSLNDRLRTAENNLAVARRLLGLVEAQKRAGRVSALEVERQRSQVAGSEAAIPPAPAEAGGARFVGSVAGTQPGPGPRFFDGAAQPCPAGHRRRCAFRVIQRRPDVRQAEANLVAANAQPERRPCRGTAIAHAGIGRWLAGRDARRTIRFG